MSLSLSPNVKLVAIRLGMYQYQYQCSNTLLVLLHSYLKPIFMLCAPRLLSRMVKKKHIFLEKNKNFLIFSMTIFKTTICQLSTIKRYFFNMALSAKGRDLDKHRVTRHML